MIEANIPTQNVRSISEEDYVRYVRVPSTTVTATTDDNGDERINDTSSEADGNDSVDDTDRDQSEDSDGFTSFIAIVSFMLVINSRRGTDE
jgi:hypothetical protein